MNEGEEGVLVVVVVQYVFVENKLQVDRVSVTNERYWNILEQLESVE